MPKVTVLLEYIEMCSIRVNVDHETCKVIFLMAMAKILTSDNVLAEPRIT